VEITASDGHRLSDVLPALRAALGTSVDGIWAGSTRLPDHLSMCHTDLRHGAALGLDRPGPRCLRGDRGSALELHVTGGPDAGRTFPVGSGSLVVGRGVEADVALDDPDVSRRHLEICIGGGIATVRDLGSTNGSRLEGAELAEAPAPWPSGTPVRIGGTTLALVGSTSTPAALDAAPGGRTRVRPPTRFVAPPVEIEVTVPPPPAAPQSRRLAWAAIALPAVAGVLLAWLLRTPTFLFFALLSPVVALGTWWSERWSGRRTRRRDAARHAAELVTAESRLAEAVAGFGRAAHARAPDLAELAAASRRRTSLLWSRRPQDDDAMTVRLGTGPGPTSVIRHADGRRTAECADSLPVTIELRSTGGLTVTGPRTRTLGVLRSIVGQLVVLHSPGTVNLMVVVDRDRLSDWRWLRWLPHLVPGGVTTHDGAQSESGADERLGAWLAAVEDSGRGETGAAGGDRPVRPSSWHVVLVDGRLSPATAAALRAARASGVLVVTHGGSVEAAPVPAEAVLQLGGETGDVGVLRRRGSPDRAGVTVDRLPADVAAELARDLADLEPAAEGTSLPERVRLLDLDAHGLRITGRGEADGTWSRSRDTLVAPLGVSPDGVATVDLCRHGPHALVAGTTGSGKSELLQCLIAGLALNHPPDRCAFLLVDYKGGAAFADAAALPHTVGLLTDLDGQTTRRALRSLAAELVRREQVLARYGVADISALPDDADLARLVIVVDEFATLAEELPTFVPGLVGIAQRGRSLGVHLILATQRPGGVVSPEIRANCTLRICLRTTDDADSRDVLGTAAAAHLPVDLPGRAFVRAGTGAPVPIHVARVSQQPAIAGAAEPRVRLWPWPISAGPPDRGAGPDGETDLALVVRALQRLAVDRCVPFPHQPWRPPLGARLTVTDVAHVLDGRTTGAPEALVVGLLDRPDQQAQEPLALDLREGGGWLAVGGPRSGRTTLLRTVLRVAARRLPAARLHIHVIDLGGGSLAAEAARLPQAGTAIARADALRIVRLVDRLADEVTARRAGGPVDADAPLILLLVDGVEAVTTLLDDCDPGRGSTALHQLVRDGAAAGLTCVLTADRAIPGGRLAAVAHRRLVLPLPDRADYAVAGVPPAAVPSERPPGRALVGEDAVECQLALADPVPHDAVPARPGGTPHRPVRVVELDPDPVLTRAATLSAEGSQLQLPLGPGGDEGELLTVDLVRTGGLLVVGPPGSGRSSTLTAAAARLASAGVPVLRLGGRVPSDESAAPSSWAAASDVSAVSAWIGGLGGRFGVVIADDVGTASESAALLTLSPAGSASGAALVAAGGAGQLATHFQGPVSALRRSRSGLLLCAGPPEAEVLGARLPRTPVPFRPGSGWLVSSGTARRIQVAVRSAGPGTA
jgi:DNA segregation ATPase FtsK/SpoIIIE, S-DNA-T family